METPQEVNTSPLNTKTSDKTMTPEEAKQLHTKLNHYYRDRKKGAKRKPKPVLKPIGDTETIQKCLTIQKSPTDWDDLANGSLFAVDPSGALLFTKISNSRALCLNFMKSQPVGGAAVYRIFL
ncbi:MAG: hypothetical protein F6K36_10765 [Symploca sp. SIO3C6]|nr:hypothetical protein [Symploca sp. SIO3C6]